MERTQSAPRTLWENRDSATCLSWRILQVDCFTLSQPSSNVKFEKGGSMFTQTDIFTARTGGYWNYRVPGIL